MLHSSLYDPLVEFLNLCENFIKRLKETEPDKSQVIVALQTILSLSESSIPGYLLYRNKI